MCIELPETVLTREELWQARYDGWDDFDKDPTPRNLKDIRMFEMRAVEKAVIRKIKEGING